jgi:hypothetical protein
VRSLVVKLKAVLGALKQWMRRTEELWRGFHETV